MKGLVLSIICCCALLTTISAQASGGDIEKGKVLFNDPGLGASTNAKSCGTCHEDGDLSEAGKRKDLKKFINMCIERPLSGKPLEYDSQEMLHLEAYIKSQGK